MRTIQIKKFRYIKILVLLVLVGIARLSGYTQDLHTPYPIIFVHGIVGDQTTWTDNGEVDSFNEPIGNWDILDFLQSGTTPLKNGGFINISLDYSRNETILNEKKGDDVHVFSNMLKPADIYFVNFAVHAKTGIPFTSEENYSTIVQYSVSNSDDRIKINVNNPERFNLQDLVSIDEEIMKVSEKNGTELTLDRRKCGTKPSWHTSNIIIPLKIFNLYKESNQAAVVKQGLGIKEAIQKVLDITHAHKVILVGHSMGGLAIREYIRTYFPQRQDVAKVVTIGTPHGGSNLAVFYNNFTKTILGMDDRSDAIRDLKSGGDNFFSWIFWGNLNTYLFGGNESDVPDRFYSKDVNCNGSVNVSPPAYDDVYGVNKTVFPENIDHTWIVSTLKTDAAEFNHDGIVLNGSQSIDDNDTVRTHAGHVSLIGNIYNLPGESKDIYALIRGLDEPDEPELAYEISENNKNKGFISFGKHFDYNDIADRFDIDWFKVNISKKGLFKIDLLASSYTGIWELDLYKDVNDDPVKSITNISELIEYNITEPGFYYIKIKGAPALDGFEKHASYKYPYTLNTSIEDTPQSAMTVSPSSLQYYDVMTTAPKSKTITLTNNGSVDILVTSIGLSDVGQFTAAPMPPFAVTPEQPLNLSVTFNPTSIGLKESTLEITTNSPDIPLKIVNLKGFGTDHETKFLSINIPTSYTFPDTKINLSKTKTFSLQNTGSSVLTVSDLSIGGLNPDPYSITSAPTIPFDIGTGEIKYVTVKYSPTTVGSTIADLLITNNSDNRKPIHYIELKGTGIENYYTGDTYNSLFAYEYWFDDQYTTKVKNNVLQEDVSLLDAQIPTEGLESGLHNIHIRYQDIKGKWSGIVSDFFHKLPVTPVGSPKITASEYWFDDGFASKVSTAITSSQTVTANGGFDVGSLTNGLHSYHVRYQDDAGQWSSVVSEFFQKLPVAQAGTRNITASEYWFDDDFANKISAAITPGQNISINGGFDVSKLESGLHSYHTRYKDDAGQWSSVVSEFFQKLPATAAGSRTITASEYWFDDGFAGKVTTAITPGQTITANGGFDVGSLTNGLHSYHVRYQDDAGQWSSVVSEFFQKLPVAQAGTRNITASEYWFDDDYSTKISAAITPGQKISISGGFDVSKLESGLHSYHTRYKDDAGQWSSVVSEFFQKLPVAQAGSRTITASEYWFDDGFASKVTTAITPGQTITANGGFDVGSLTNGLHSYHVRYKDDAGQWSSVVSEFFQKLPAYASENNLITTYRYWFNSNSQAMITETLAEPINPYQLVRNINTCSLTEGNHILHFQFQDSNHQWSAVTTDAITKSATLIPVITASGATTFCQGTNVTLTSSAADSYLWSNGATTQSIIVSTKGNYSLTVNKDSGCEATSGVMAIVVNPLPNAAAVISGISRVAKNQMNVSYSVPVIENASSYTWTLPEGATGTSATNTISVSFGNDAVSGDIIVKGHNDCGDGLESSLAITVTSISTQDIALNTGWNIISSNVVPTNLNLKDIFQPLIDAGKLKKVMDETGKTIENFGGFGGWVNYIGNLISTEGYKVNVTAPSTLSLEGMPVPLPMDISLNTGWNIISYPASTLQDAKEVVQALIDAGKLKKVMDETGRTIENFGSFGGWKNSIGNFTPGKGYKVSVTENCILNIPATMLKTAVIVPEVLASTHFTKVFSGNGTDHMNIYLVNLQNSGLLPGDEIGVFDGQYCVGSVKIGMEQLADGSVNIPASGDDGLSQTVNGFRHGNPIALQLFREGQTYSLNMEKVGGNELFEMNASLFAKVSTSNLTVLKMTDEATLFKCYPNPFTREITIEVQNFTQADITVEIYNMTGQRIKNLYEGHTNGNLLLKWNGANESGQQVAPGVYLCKVNGMVKQVIFEGGKK